ncbi:MAG: glycosyltransferase family 4 protein [Leptospiraceae bacterium]|nr:glycosyltransferase family 4 protein [Leptospiraceae bacterium]
MQPQRLIQFSTGFNPGDAISNQILTYSIFAKKHNMGALIFAEHISQNSKNIAKKYKNYSPKNGDVLLYHHSIHSDVLEKLLNLPLEIPKILAYHNVTPKEFFEPYNLRLAYYSQKGREELKEIKNLFSVSLADSEYNAAELRENGFTHVKVLPIGLDYSIYTKHKRQTQKKTILFTGRIAPNKKQIDLVKVAKMLYDYFTQDFELVMVGKTAPEMQDYKEEILELIEYFHLQNHVKLTEFLDQEDLNKEYSNADIFLCLSEHEGFCVPLLEAMHYELPIIAYNKSAVPETLRGSGILFYEKDFYKIAEIIYVLFHNQELKDKIIENQNKVLRYYKSIDYEREILQILTSKSLEVGLY